MIINKDNSDQCVHALNYIHFLVYSLRTGELVNLHRCTSFVEILLTTQAIRYIIYLVNILLRNTTSNGMIKW